MPKKIKILMVDDEARFREATKKILNRKGFEVILANDGMEALEKLSMDPDVIVLDIKMPGMDGHETLKEIKSRQKDIPVIMLTGHGGLPSAEEAYISGAFDYLSKPCDIELLSGRIIDACREKGEEIDVEEKPVDKVMVPLGEYTTISEDGTVKHAVKKLLASFYSKLSTDHLMETGHRSVLVVNHKQSVTGILTITDLLQAIMPGYLSISKPFMADAIEFSPMFWTGMFARELRDIRDRKVGEIMSPAPLEIPGSANLMEAAYMMIHSSLRRLLVSENDKIVGVLREQDLFFEMRRILSE
jgi:DNA-binding response OmpR family regulator